MGDKEERREKTFKTYNLFYEIIAGKFPNLRKGIDIYIQEVQLD
jgi:hypothetical protein